ncbi:hypothetical protein AWN76_002630 [Rhodothermaceae bacterium RA]|nr:hypothetical protein AWN76_002630 [Rhodothermaceae bacterium RA]
MSPIGLTENEKSRIFQARAFEALMSYILEKNGFPKEEMFLDGMIGTADDRTHTEALSRLAEMKNMDMIVDLCPDIGCGWDPDPVQATRSLGNFARALDLYYALEAAYAYFGDDVLALRAQVFSSNLVDQLKDKGGKAHGAAESNYGTRQPGNAPMKLYLAAAYAEMSLPLAEARYVEGLAYLDIFLNNAFDSAYEDHWRWQTGEGGNRFWAEGAYYLHFALRDVVPFWHSTRASGLLQAYRPSIPDPFSNSWFLEPLEWMADIATPGGYTPPIDDGNKRLMDMSSILRWSASYGNEDTQSQRVAEKFAWINENLAGIDAPGTEENMLLVELAMPRTEVPASNPIPSRIVNSSSILTEGDEQQQVLRETYSGQEHYVFLNGEHGRAIDKGEGHEQPDNMQLLYNVGNHSYLVDSGYDDARFAKSAILHNDARSASTWSWYHDNNVMRGYINFSQSYIDTYVPELTTPEEGRIYETGMPRPFWSTSEGHVISHHMQDAEQLYTETAGNLDVVHAKLTLKTQDVSGTYGDYADYVRKTLFIRGDASQGVAPYLIDLNAQHAHTLNQNHVMVMSYHGNSEEPLTYKPSTDEFIVWESIDRSPDNHLFLYPDVVEGPSFLGSDTYTVHPDSIAERSSSDKRHITRLDIYGATPSLSQVKWHTTVAFIKAITNTSLNDLASKLADVPQPYRPPITSPSYYSNQAWTWQQNSNTVDVFATRSASVMLGGDAPHDEAFQIGAAGGLYVELPQDADFGFIRLKQVNGIWQPTPGYQYQMSVCGSGAPTPPTNLDVLNRNDVGDPVELGWEPSSSMCTTEQNVYACSSYSGCYLLATVPANAISYTDTEWAIADPDDCPPSNSYCEEERSYYSVGHRG